MKRKNVGKQSVEFENPPVLLGTAAVVGKKESEGPYGHYFDEIVVDSKFGMQTWEEAEEKFQETAAKIAIKKSGCTKKDIRYIIAGDLLGQLIASSFGLMNLDIPVFGVYGACSTMGESMSIASALVDGGFADCVLALTSSHFATAEKQFRFPLGYGNQRPKAATWTVTGCGAVVISSAEKAEQRRKEKEKAIQVMGITTGKIVDYGVKDSMNMGACMAPAAADVICQNLEDFQLEPQDYDQIITGDLGRVGKDILIDICKAKGYDISKQYFDCGIEIYGNEKQVQAGGSGCACSAVMLAGFITEKLRQGKWNRVLFVPTGALLSTVSFNEGKSVPGIAHGVIFESR